MSLYEILQLPVNSNELKINSQFLKLQSLYNQDQDSISKDEYKKIENAYKILSCKYGRAFYNAFGDFGLSFLKSSDQIYIFTRLFSRNLLKFLTGYFLIFFFYVLGFPVLIKLICEKKNLTNLWLPTLPYWLTTVLATVFHLQAKTILKEDPNINTKQIKRYLNYHLGKLYAFNLQILVFVFVFDQIITEFRILWLVPFIIFEVLYTFQRRRMTIETKGKKNREKLCVKTLLGVFIRSICILPSIFDIQGKFKILTLPFLVVVECFLNSFTLFYIAIFFCLSSLYTISLYEALSETLLWRLLCLELFYILFAIFFIFLWIKYNQITPKSKFKNVEIV